MGPKIRRSWLLAAGLGLAACSEGTDERDAAQRSPGEVGRVIVADRDRMEAPREPDNTGRNVRDADGATLTPGDQPNTAQDLDLARRIREAVTSDASMSTNAQNVKIIAQGGAVTLRGPVKSEQEKLAIQSIAQQTPGVSRVDNLLEVDPDVEIETESEYEEDR